jgi:DNA-binding beta-propeller fold protein YncE
LWSWGGGPIGSAPGQFYGPRSIAVAPNGRVFVADTGNKRIEVFTAHGKFLFTWGTAGKGPGQFQEPSSVAVGPDGTVYVTDFWNQRVQVFDATGRFLRSWPVPEWTPGSYDEPYVTVSPSGSSVYVTQPQQQRVAEYTTTGRLLGVFGSGQMTTPVGVAALPGGKIAVSDSGANRVNVFAVASPAASASPPPLHRPSVKGGTKP